MGTLAYNDLLKPATKKEPVPRVIRFIEKMEKSGTFEMADGKSATFLIALKHNKDSIKKLREIKVTGEAQHRAAYNQISFIDTQRKEYKLTKFKKTAEFGGGAGSGGGAALTKYTESGQCYVCSLVFNVLKRKIETAEDWARIKEGEGFCDTGMITLDQIIQNVGNDEDWTVSMIRTANLLFDDYGTKFKSPVYFHRDSKFMKKIYKEGMAECLEKNPVSVVGKFDNNKWNPGDIWMTTLTEVQQTQLKFQTMTWKDLNEQILQLAKDNKLLAVSLKKVTGKATKEVYNDSSIAKTQYRFSSYRLSAPSKSFFNSIDMYLDISGTEVQFRATATTKSWQGEVKGGSAAGGKIGGGPTNNYLKHYTGEGLFDSSENEVLLETKRPDFMKKFFALYKKYHKPSTIDPLIEDLKTFEAAAKAKDAESPGSFFFSKYMNLKFLDIMISANKENQVCNDLMHFAKSNIEESSYFIKIS